MGVSKNRRGSRSKKSSPHENQEEYKHGPDEEEEKEDDELMYDPSAYKLYKEFDLGFPCMSFTLLPDMRDLQKNEVKVKLVAGSHINNRSENKIAVVSIDGLMMHEPTEEESSDSYEEIDTVLNHQFINHYGIVNRLKHTSLYNREYVAVHSDQRQLCIFDITGSLLHLDDEGKRRNSKNSPLYTIRNRAEGYALDWGCIDPEDLAFGLCDGSLHLYKINQSKWELIGNAENAHNGSLEDIQWSPTERNVLGSCDTDGRITLWDSRSFNKSIVSNLAHDTECNVISWNRSKPVIASGDDNGLIKLWDLRYFSKGDSSPFSTINYHKKAVTSLEWSSFDATTFISSSEDNQLAMWDLSLEPSSPDENPTMPEVPKELLFVHMGQQEIKEIHWHNRIEGVILSTALSGFNIFKTISA